MDFERVEFEDRLLHSTFEPRQDVISGESSELTMGNFIVVNPYPTNVENRVSS